MNIKIPAEVWLDDKRINHPHVERPGNAELSAFEGKVELAVPVDLGLLATTITVTFPLSALLRLNQTPGPQPH
ncbi:MAG: hypothetical protein CK429_34065 [Mycobacterium sp.]|uniref:hypothetical protein n=1 Tax=Mycobacterium sp. MS3 TaxID=3391378 RepID=UPI000CB468C8|nr:MAG: hypothetical protein CK429_34065 [Mycobacterium sp.]